MLKKSLKKFTGIFATTMIMANTIGSSVPVMAAIHQIQYIELT